MARSKEQQKEYMRDYMKRKRANKDQSANKSVNNSPGANTGANKTVQPGATPIEWHPEIDQKMFDGHGRGSIVNGYVLISLGRVPDDQPDHGVVTEKVWRQRLDYTCPHGYMGWSCKACL